MLLQAARAARHKMDRTEGNIMEDAITIRTIESDGWAVAGVLRDLAGAVLTTQPGEAGLAGTVELNEELREAANDAVWEGALP